MIKRTDIDELCEAAAIAGIQVAPSSLAIVEWPAGEGHRPVRLPTGMAAVYIFKKGGECLKVGKVNAKSSNRYQFHHYDPTSSMSNLAKSLIACPDFPQCSDPLTVADWIKQNTTRYNILIPETLGKKFVHFAEAFFILKCDPRFEDGRI